LRVFRLSRIRGKVAYATKAEHDFKRPADFDPREYANRAEWQFGDTLGTAEIEISERIAWQVERHYGPYGAVNPTQDGHGVVFSTDYASPRHPAAWVLRLGEHARVIGPADLRKAVAERVKLLASRHRGKLDLAAATGGRSALNGQESSASEPRREAA